MVERGGLMTDAKYNDLRAGEKLAGTPGCPQGARRHPGQVRRTRPLWRIERLDDGGRHARRHPQWLRAFEPQVRAGRALGPEVALFAAWQLSLWYQDLALLYLLNHKGEYRNRVTAESIGLVETVPWA